MGNFLTNLAINHLDYDKIEDMERLSRLTERVNSLETENTLLRKELELQKGKYETTHVTENSRSQNVKINIKEIDKLIEKYLDNEDINCDYIPDYVEKKIYQNILTMGTGLLLETLNSGNIKLFGQTIECKINESVENTSTSTEN